MITSRPNDFARAIVLIGVVALVLDGCTEPVSTKAAAPPERTLEARLVMSDSAPVTGKTVDVFAQITASTPELIGSYTARIRYDTTALRFEQEIPIADDALRATNPTSGLL